MTMQNLAPCNTHRDEDLVPGTVHLVQEARNGKASKNDIVLIPTPSADLTDPLVGCRYQDDLMASKLIPHSDGHDGARVITSSF